MPEGRVAAALDRLDEWFDASGLSGWDPYDALDSPLLAHLPFRFGRIAATQLLKRSPVNLRPLLGVRRTRNPKAIALMLSAWIRRGDTARARRAFEALASLRSPGETDWCWGYPFPWQSRAFLLPRWTPTAVVTSFAGHALLDAHEAWGDPAALEMARSACRFLLRLHRGDGWFTYSPLDTTAIHNAGMLAAALLARAGGEEGHEAARAAARRLLRFQRPDGGWHYAETPTQRWIDSFHTGFLLVALRRVIREAGLEEAAPALERGVRFYVERFFESDGAPRYYHDRARPYDIHSAAQAMITLADLGVAPDLLRRVVAWALDHLWDRRGFFRMRPHNPIAYLRWGQAWAYAGLTAWRDAQVR